MSLDNSNPSHPRQPSKMPPWAIILCAALLGLIFAVGIVLYQRGRGGHTSLTVGASKQIEPGVMWHEVDLPGGDGTRTLWIYEPQHPRATKLPCVFIAPSGSTCFTGMKLDDGDRLEQVPYVREGWIVVAYSLDGNIDDRKSDNSIYKAIQAFKAAHSGFDNEQGAVAYALNTLPAIDMHRMYAVGHSSAATMALLAASQDHRFKGCVAYAPRCDVASEMNDRGASINDIVPNFTTFLADCSPINHAQSIECPVYLFHADDDSAIPTEDVARFAGVLSQTNSQVMFTRVPAGGHYDSMIQQGIPRGINWIKQH